MSDELIHPTSEVSVFDFSEQDRKEVHPAILRAGDRTVYWYLDYLKNISKEILRYAQNDNFIKYRL